jgi:hypothetical protein
MINFKQIFFCFDPHQFLIEYLSVGIHQSVRKVPLQGQILSCCTSKRLKSKPNMILLDGIANVKRESTKYCTGFEPHLHFLFQTVHVIPRLKHEDEHTNVMVLAAGF